MSGKHSGVSASVQSLAKHAFYVHYKAHCLNLVIVDTVSAAPEVSCFFSSLQHLYVFLSGLYVHQKWQDIQYSMYPKDQPQELPRLSDIRWARRYYDCWNLMDLLPAGLQDLHNIDEENNGDRSVEAHGLWGQTNRDFIYLLATFKIILRDTKFFSNMPQSSSLDLDRDIIDIIEALQDSMLIKYRDEPSFDQL